MKKKKFNKKLILKKSSVANLNELNTIKGGVNTGTGTGTDDVSMILTACSCTCNDGCTQQAGCNDTQAQFGCAEPVSMPGRVCPDEGR